MTSQEYVQGLRDLAEWIERNADSLTHHSDFMASDDFSLTFLRSDPVEFAEFAKMLGGHRAKWYDDDYLNVERTFGAATVRLFTRRQNVCERVVTGTREVVEKVRDPEMLERVPLVEVTRTEEIVEWRCNDAILGLVPEPAEVAS